MPRIRTIKPEMASDPTLSKVSRDARYTFVLLITQADDYGLVPGKPRQLIGSLYPHDEDVTETILMGWVGELESIGIVRFLTTDDGAVVLELVNWGKHQRIDNRGKSTLAEKVGALAESRRENPRTSESVGENPLGPRTLDLGNRTLDHNYAQERVTPSAVADDLATLCNRHGMNYEAMAMLVRQGYGASEIEFAILKAKANGKTPNNWAPYLKKLCDSERENPTPPAPPPKEGPKVIKLSEAERAMIEGRRSHEGLQATA